MARDICVERALTDLFGKLALACPDRVYRHERLILAAGTVVKLECCDVWTIRVYCTPSAEELVCNIVAGKPHMVRASEIHLASD